MPSRSKYLCQVDGFDCYVFTSVSEAAGYWRSLEASAWSTPFQRYDWNAGAGDDPEDNIEPQIVIGFRSGEPKILLPLAIETGLLGRRLTWLRQQYNDYNAPVVDREVAHGVPELFEGIVAFLARTRVVDALHVLRWPTGFGLPKQLHRETIKAEYSSHVAELSTDWTETYRKLRSSKSRQRIRGKLNSLRQLGKVTFRRVRHRAERVQLAHKILEWKSEQLDGLGHRNPFGNLRSGLGRAILSVLSGNASNMAVYGLFLDGMLIAGVIAFIDASRFSLFVTAYDPKGPTQVSPGVILLVKTFELSARAGLESYDLLIGDEAYKSDWSHSVPVYHLLQAFTAAGVAYCWTRKARLHLKKWLLARPLAMTTIHAFNRARIRWLRRVPSVTTISKKGGLSWRQP